MMKRNGLFALFLLGTAALSGWLMQKPSLVGRVGIAVMYKEYSFLRTWWKTALIEAGVFFFLLVLISLLRNKLSISAFRVLLIVLLLCGLVGFYFTWTDFHETTTHRWLKERFHMGAYLFWVGFLSIPVYFFFQPVRKYADERGHTAVQKES